MLFLLFQLGQDRYALEARNVAQVVPLVNLKKIPGAPEGVAGAFNYRGTLVPVIDVKKMALGLSSACCLSTRIILVSYPVQEDESRLLGLMAERATEMLNLELTAFVNSGIETSNAPYLGPLARDQAGLIQKIVLEKLLNPRVRAVLFRHPLELTPQ